MMKKLLHFQMLLFLCYVVPASIHAQYLSYVTLTPGMSEDSIVATAARIVPSPGQLRWQQLELTAFFHFGMNTFTDKEWGEGTESEKLFNPGNLDANQWVRICKQAGFRQVILTVKHLDGFCLWPSKYTSHSVINSPWKNGHVDVVRELSEACHRQGIGFGIYLSPWDRNNRLYGSEAYNKYFINQLTELLTGYGRVDEVWFDGASGVGINGKKQRYDFTAWYQLIRKLQPNALIAVMGPDIRWVGTESGYGREQEWSVVPVESNTLAKVAAGSQQTINLKPIGDMTSDVLGSREKIKKASALAWYPAETDVSIRPGWFYHQKEDIQVKTGQELMDIYLHSVGRNGVLLLNIPPNREGRLAEADSVALISFKKLREAYFQKNLLASA